MNLSKYYLKINNKYFKDFEEIEEKKTIGKGSYSNGHFIALNAILSTDTIILTEKEQAKVIEGRINLKNIIAKIVSDSNYKFKKIEIEEI